MYALVLLKPHTGHRPGRDLDARHEEFITARIRRNEILLGGPLANGEAAYVLRAASLDEARELASGDPYVGEGAFESEVVEWRLVGVNASAIDPEVALGPADV